jgi:hypothetical protein
VTPANYGVILLEAKPNHKHNIGGYYQPVTELLLNPATLNGPAILGMPVAIRQKKIRYIHMSWYRGLRYLTYDALSYALCTNHCKAQMSAFMMGAAVLDQKFL